MNEKNRHAASQVPEQVQLNKAALTMLLVALVTVAGPIWYLASTHEDSASLAFLLLVLPSVLIAAGAMSLLLVEQRPPLLTIGIVLSEATKNLFVVIYIVAIKGWLSHSALAAFS